MVNFIWSLTSGVRVLPKNRYLAATPLPVTLAVMEVLYDLEVPYVEVLGLVVTVAWSLLVVASCGYFVLFWGMSQSTPGPVGDYIQQSGRWQQPSQ